MRLRSSLIGLVAALLLAGPAARATEMPFESEAGMIWVTVSAAGSAAPLHFLLDSGASVSVLDLGAARRLGTRLGAPRSVQGVHSSGTAYGLPSFAGQAGGTQLPSSILALDLSAVSARCHRRIDGLLGADFFRGRTVQIDFAARKVRLLAAGEVNAGGSDVLPLSTRQGIFCVRVSVAGGPANWTRVDTGCNTALQWVAAQGNAGHRNTASIGLASGGESSMCTDVQLGSERLTGVTVGVHTQPIFAGEAGLLGNGLLSRFASVTFDLAGHRLLLAKR